MGWFGKKSNKEVVLNERINEIIVELEQKGVYCQASFHQLSCDGLVAKFGSSDDVVDVGMLHVLGIVDYLKKLALMSQYANRNKRIDTVVEGLIDRSDVMRVALNLPSELFNLDGEVSVKLRTSMKNANKIRMPIENVIEDLKELQKDLGFKNKK